MRYRDRVRFRAQVQYREQSLLRTSERRPFIGPERWLFKTQKRLLLPALLGRLQLVQERGPHKGQELPQPSRG